MCAMYVSSVSINTLNCVVVSISQGILTQVVPSLVFSVLKGITVNGHVQHLEFDCLVSALGSLGRCTVR